MQSTTTTTPTDAPSVSHGDGHAHEHHPMHQHHFASMDQQFDSAKMGMWIFLVTEVLLFSGMFVAYTVFRAWYPETFMAVSDYLDWQLGGLNTLVLLGSSFTVALSIHFIQQDKVKRAQQMILLTFLAGLIFMCVKAVEYGGKISSGVVLGEGFAPTGTYEALASIPYAQQFFSIYYVMTGIHGVHVLVGMGIFAWLYTRLKRGHFDSTYYTHIELAGLYWHLVDIIWIFLFPLLYLIGHGGH